MKSRFKVWILLFVSLGVFLIAFVRFIKRHYESWQAMGGISFYDHIIIYDFWATYTQIALYAISALGVLIRNRVGWMMITFGLYSYWGYSLGFLLWINKNITNQILSTLTGLIIFVIIFYLTSNKEAKSFFKSADVKVFSAYSLAPLIAGILCGLFVGIGMFYISFD